MGGYVNKEVCVNIELFLLVFVHEKKSASCIRSSRMNVLWFLMDFCQVSYRCGLLKVGKFAVHVHRCYIDSCWPCLKLHSHLHGSNRTG